MNAEFWTKRVMPALAGTAIITATGAMLVGCGNDTHSTSTTTSTTTVTATPSTSTTPPSPTPVADNPACVGSSTVKLDANWADNIKSKGFSPQTEEARKQAIDLMSHDPRAMLVYYDASPAVLTNGKPDPAKELTDTSQIAKELKDGTCYDPAVMPKLNDLVTLWKYAILTPGNLPATGTNTGATPGGQAFSQNGAIPAGHGIKVTFVDASGNVIGEHWVRLECGNVVTAGPAVPGVGSPPPGTSIVNTPPPPPPETQTLPPPPETSTLPPPTTETTPPTTETTPPCTQCVTTTETTPPPPTTSQPPPSEWSKTPTPNTSAPPGASPIPTIRPRDTQQSSLPPPPTNRQTVPNTPAPSASATPRATVPPVLTELPRPSSSSAPTSTMITRPPVS